MAAACDDEYAMPMAAMLSSLASTLAPERTARAYLLQRHLSSENREKLERSIPPDRVELRWLGVEERRLAPLRRQLRPFDYLSIETYDRLLLGDVLPPELEKVVYLDCDVVLKHDLADLWDVELGDAYVGAVAELDPHGGSVSSANGLRLFRELGLPGDLKVFNSGVMSINLRRWRHEQLGRRVIHYLREAGDSVRWHDQDGLNSVVAGEWRELDPRWNVTMHVHRRGFPREEADRLVRDAYLIHFNTSIKPWHPGFPFPSRELFFLHLDRTAWKGWRPRPESRFPLLERLPRRIERAVAKRVHTASTAVRRTRQRLHAWSALRRLPRQVGGRKVPQASRGEVRVFTVVGAQDTDVPESARHHLAHGADRVLLACRGSSRMLLDSTIARHERLHVFEASRSRRTSHEILRALLHRYGRGHWCLVVEPNELLVSAHGPPLALRELCDRLARAGVEGLTCRVLETPDRNSGPAGGHRDHRAPASRIETIARDPLLDRRFPAVLDADRGPADQPLKALSKVVLFRYRPGLLIADDQRAVHGIRLASDEAELVRLRSGSPS